ncbi:hypothetical protein I317_01997 [Kwoniella heveanensis CBS 569]|nr:hypothetical protein I317_01997 [Kwoniella heveanensis CBS 569]
MAKSIRAKAKMASRARKRLQTHYAVTDAARTQRLSDKLLGKDKAATEATEEGKEEMQVEGEGEDAAMDGGDQTPKKISTSGPKGSRRESWRLSKGMSAKPKKSANGCKNKRRR